MGEGFRFPLANSGNKDVKMRVESRMEFIEREKRKEEDVLR